MIRQQLTFGSKTLEFQVKYTERKTLGIAVYPTGQVVVTAPLASHLKDVKTKVYQKAPWILRQIQSYAQYQPGATSRRFLNGESHLYLGRQYRLKVVKSTKRDIKAYRGQLWIYGPATDPHSLGKQLDQWYRSRARDIFHQLLDEVFPKFKRHLTIKPPLYIRKMTTRWGSCTPSGTIILNPELIKAPKGCIEYVLVHELCHLVHCNHAMPFYQMLRKIMPDWEKWKGRLERILS